MLRPIKVVLENYPEGKVEESEAVNNPGRSGAKGRVKVPSRVSFTSNKMISVKSHKGFFSFVSRQGSAPALRLHQSIVLTW